MSNALTRRNLLQLLPLAALAPTVLGQTNTQPNSAKETPNGNSRKEVRGIWIHPERYFSANEAEGRKQVRAQVERFARANFNLILPWTRSIYLNAVERPQYHAQSPIAAWDALGVLVEEAARVGIDVDMWYSFTDYRAEDSPEFNPEVGGNPAWRAIYDPPLKNGKLVPEPQWNVCPQHAGARKWQRELLLRALDRYPRLHGVHIEEPGYETKDYCLCALCCQVFQSLHDRPLKEAMASQQAEDLRTIGTSAFVWELREELRKRANPPVLSVNGGPDWQHDRKKGRDWARWAQAGWLDYYAPQVYETTLEPFRKQLAESQEATGKHAQTYVGIAIAWSEGKSDIGTVAKQIEIAREMGVGGVLLFHGAAFQEEDLKALREGVFRSKV